MARLPSPYFLSCVSESCFMSFTFIRPEFLTKNLLGVYRVFSVRSSTVQKEENSQHLTMPSCCGRQTLPPLLHCILLLTTKNLHLAPRRVFLKKKGFMVLLWTLKFLHISYLTSYYCNIYLTFYDYFMINFN